jgi:Flp pilus assembly protein TadD
MTNAVICAACGARIGARHAHCLRCHAPLVAAADSAPAGGVTRGQRLMIAAVSALGILLIGAVAWERRLEPPTALTPLTPTSTASSESAPSVEGPSTLTAAPAPAAALDLSRSGTAAFLTGDLQRAKEQFEAALERKPNDPEALNSIGQILDRQGDIPGAIERFELAVKLAPDKWAYHFNLAHAVGRRGEWDRAAVEYREAARLFPEDYATQYNLAMALRRQGNDEAAIPEFEKAIQLAPAEASFHLALGNSLQAVGKLAEAQKAFEAYLALQPSSPDAEKVKAHIESLAAARRASGATPPGSPLE